MAVIAALAAVATPVAASQTTELAYDIVRNGAPIGTHVMRIRDNGESTQVEVQTDIVFKLLSLTVYTFRHQSLETWADDRLLALTSETDDNGTPVRLRIERQDGKLTVLEGEAPPLPLPDLLPASLWHPATVASELLMDTMDGKLMKIVSEALGDDDVEVGSARLSARRYRLSGDLARELWYDRRGHLLAVRFTAREGSEIRYRLREAPAP